MCMHRWHLGGFPRPLVGFLDQLEDRPRRTPSSPLTMAAIVFLSPVSLLDQRNAQALEVCLVGGGEPGIAAQSRGRDHAVGQ